MRRREIRPEDYFIILVIGLDERDQKKKSLGQSSLTDAMLVIDSPLQPLDVGPVELNGYTTASDLSLCRQLMRKACENIVQSRVLPHPAS